MKKIFRDFISMEDRKYSFKLGKTVASSLTGFVVGAAAAHLVWFLTAKKIVEAMSNLSY